MNDIISNHNLKDSHSLFNFIRSVVSLFYGRKEVMAIQALKGAGFTHEEIAKKMDYPSAKAVGMKLRRYGRAK